MKNICISSFIIFDPNYKLYMMQHWCMFLFCPSEQC